MENWWEDPDFGTLEEDQVKSHPIPRAILKRIVYFPCGILTSLFGLILVNIPLRGEESVPLGMDFGSVLFLGGMLLIIIGGPYLLLASIFGDGRIIFWKKRKEWYEFQRLHEAIRIKPIIAHYWEALRDPDHPHHSEIRRYGWMDAIKWKHRPLEVFGFMTITRESGEQRDGAIVPKRSTQYKLSNDLLRVEYNHKWNREEYVKGPNASPVDINLFDRRVWGGFLGFVLIANLFFYIPASLFLALNGNDSYSVRDSLFTLASQPILLILLAWVFTDLLGPLGRNKGTPENLAKDMDMEEIKERMEFLIERYSTVRDKLSPPPIEMDGSINRIATRYGLPVLSLFASVYVVGGLDVEFESDSGLGLASLLLLLAGVFSLATLALKHTRLTMKNATFAGYRLSDTHLHLFDGLYGIRMRKGDIPEHSCVRIVDRWDFHSARQNKAGEWEGRKTTRKGYNVVLHLIWLRDEDPAANGMLTLLWEIVRKPGLPAGRVGFLEIDLEGDGVRPWVGEYRIRFQFRSKKEQREFAERLASDLDLPVKMNWKWKKGKKYHSFIRNNPR
jgi:hypothetical protein